MLYNSSGDSGQRWHHGANFLMHFVHWRDENPKFNVPNISWVDHWAGDGGTIIKEGNGIYGSEKIDKVG